MRSFGSFQHVCAWPASVARKIPQTKNCLRCRRVVTNYSPTSSIFNDLPTGCELASVYASLSTPWSVLDFLGLCREASLSPASHGLCSMKLQPCRFYLRKPEFFMGSFSGCNRALNPSSAWCFHVLCSFDYWTDISFFDVASAHAQQCIIFVLSPSSKQGIVICKSNYNRSRKILLTSPKLIITSHFFLSLRWKQ